jgi:hypothetical protein
VVDPALFAPRSLTHVFTCERPYTDELRARVSRTNAATERARRLTREALTAIGARSGAGEMFFQFPPYHENARSHPAAFEIVPGSRLSQDSYFEFMVHPSTRTKGPVEHRSTGPLQ